MNGCVYRTEDNKCKFWSDFGKGIVSYCDPCDCEEKTMSNADKIRSMTDEELAFYIVNHPMWSDESACIAWLKESISGERK